MKFQTLVCCALTLYAAAANATGTASLPALNVDTADITTSGLSSGAAMAVQLGYAYSATIKGVGAFAGSPYSCQGHYVYTACQNNSTISPNGHRKMETDINWWSGTLIDDKANVAKQKVYLFVGANDATSGPNPMVGLQKQYLDVGVPVVSLTQHAVAAHVFPTDFDTAGNARCDTSSSPYVANCGYDGAKAVLSHFYGTLKARNDSPAPANYIQFNQNEFTGNPGMDSTGWVYVPRACTSGTKCKLHVAFHGCLQNYASVGDRFIKNTGYTRWADTNNIIVLFPQTRADWAYYRTPANGVIPNPNACWDTVGFYGTQYSQKAGAQLSAIKAMVDRISSASR